MRKARLQPVRQVREIIASLAVVFLCFACATSPTSSSTTDDADDGVEQADATVTTDAVQEDVHAADTAHDGTPDTLTDAESATDVPSMNDVTEDVREDVLVDARPDTLNDAEADVPPDIPPCVPVVSFGVELVQSTFWSADLLPICEATAHAMVVPRSARWTVALEDAPSDARIEIYGPRYRRALAGSGEMPEPIATSAVAGPDGETEVDFVAERSGEYVAVVSKDDPTLAAAYQVRALCEEGCDLEATRYPIVLVHGYAGTDEYFGILEYFYDIRGPLRDAGYEVFSPITNPLALSTVRAEELSSQVNEIFEETGAAKINIIAHSQGGLDSRVLISGMGYADRVASLTTVATPHLGVPARIFEFVTVQSFDPEVMEAFNETYPDAPEVRYWSWSARSCGRLAFRCQRNSDGEVIELLLIAPFNILNLYGDNDGIVTTASMIWGDHLGRLNADHFDQIGQVADGSPRDDPFDHRAFYRDEARRLAAAGF